MSASEDSVSDETGVPLETVSDEDSSLPQWTDTKLCGRCQTYTSYLTFRSHCRICGKSVCSACREEAVPDKWLDVPYVRLCRGIPDTHKNSMKACVDCAETARQSEADYLWKQLLHRTISDDTHARHWKEMASKKQDNEYMAKAAEALMKKYESLVNLNAMEYANCNFSHDKTSHRLIQHDKEVHLFDIVYNTKKMEKATEGDISSMTIPFHFATTILSCSGLKEMVAQHIQRKHANVVPSVYQLIATSNKKRVLKMLRPEHIQCLYMHFPHEEDIQRALPLSMRGDVDRHRAFMDILTHMGEQDHAQRESIVKDLSKARVPTVFLFGTHSQIGTIGYQAPNIFTLGTRSGRTVSVFTKVNSDLIKASAYASWALFRYAFQGLLRLGNGRSILITVPSSASMAHFSPADVYKVPQPAGGQIRQRRKQEGSEPSALEGGGGVKARTEEQKERERQEFLARCTTLTNRHMTAMWALLRTATTGSILLQCVILTILQYTTKKKVDRSKLRFAIDEAERLIVYDAPLLEAGVEHPSGVEEGAWSKKYMKSAGVQQVHKSCQKLFQTNREYVFWCGTILNGGELLTEPIKELEPDSPWVFSF